MAVTAAYTVAGLLGLLVEFPRANASPVWPPAGVALAAFLLIGYRIWPAILVGSLIVNLGAAGSPATSVGIAIGNTLEGVVGAYLVARFANGARAFERAPDVFKFVFLAAVVSTALSSIVRITTLAAGGYASWGDFGSDWLPWWLGEATGTLVVAPPLLLWGTRPLFRPGVSQALELAALAVALALVAAIVFVGLGSSGPRDDPIGFLALPLLIWAAYRFGPRETATAILLLSGIAIWGTLDGSGPFARAPEGEALVLLQTFVAVASLTSLTLAALVSERGEVERRLRELAVSDPLTGLANYGRLTQVLDAEMLRSQRTERPFAILFLDLDKLKLINDQHGHLVGSRALCRLAEAMRGSSRAIDTPCRFGGDEFAIVLPETEEEAARRVGRRIVERLQTDGGHPPLTVSLGVAVYPRDGESAENLLSVADRELYGAKARISDPTVTRTA